jgi:hypothetical protein
MAEDTPLKMPLSSHACSSNYVLERVLLPSSACSSTLPGCNRAILVNTYGNAWKRAIART